MGVQYFGTSPASSNAYLSTVKNNRREPDLLLQPLKEGLSFTLRLLHANRMAKVVEIECNFDKKGQVHDLSKRQVRELFHALGSNEDNDSEGEGEDADSPQVQDEYRPNDDVTKAGGLPHLESLTIRCSNATADTPSFITALTSFLSHSGSFPRFTHLTLQGVNLRGTAYDLRGLAECFRLHQRVRYVQMSSCWFTQEQQADMPSLQQVFKEQEHKAAQESRSSQLKFGKDASSGVVYAGPTSTSSAGLRHRAAGKSNAYVRDTDQQEAEVAPDDAWWGEKVLNFFCMFCPIGRK